MNYFAHSGAAAHTHVETAAGDATVFWIAVVSVVALGLIAAATWWLSNSRNVQPQEQKPQKKDE